MLWTVCHYYNRPYMFFFPSTTSVSKPTLRRQDALKKWWIVCLMRVLEPTQQLDRCATIWEPATRRCINQLLRPITTRIALEWESKFGCDNDRKQMIANMQVQLQWWSHTLSSLVMTMVVKDHFDCDDDSEITVWLRQELLGQASSVELMVTRTRNLIATMIAKGEAIQLQGSCMNTTISKFDCKDFCEFKQWCDQGKLAWFHEMITMFVRANTANRKLL